MTDLEITKLCAEAMGYLPDVVLSSIPLFCHMDGATDSKGFDYDPIHDDAQALELVKKFRLRVIGSGPPYSVAADPVWIVEQGGNRAETRNEDLNRAVCECVAKIQKQKEE